MKTIGIFLKSGLAALAAGGFLAPSGQAGMIFSTFGEWSALTGPPKTEANWGADPANHTFTYGQTFTAPSDPDASKLATVRFKLEYLGSGNPSFNFDAYVYRWDSANSVLTGSRLNAPSAPVPGIAPLGMQTIEVSTGVVPLQGGAEYMIFLSTVGYELPGSGGVSWGILPTGAQTEPEKSAAGRFWFNNGTSAAAWTKANEWAEYDPVQETDLAFEFVLVPEPGTYGLVAAVGLLGFAWLRRRNK